MRPLNIFRKRARKDKAVRLKQHKKSSAMNINRVWPGRYQEEDDTFMFI